MPVFQRSIIPFKFLPLNIFERLRDLLRDMAESLGALLITEELLYCEELSQEIAAQKFTVLVSQQFSALLIGTNLQITKSDISLSVIETEIASIHPPEKNPDKSDISHRQNKRANEYILNSAPENTPNIYKNLSMVQTGLTFDPEAIACHLNYLCNLLKNQPATKKMLEQAILVLQPNDPSIQSNFTFSLIEILASYYGEQNNMSDNIDLPNVVDRQIEASLRQQVEQERLLNQVITQIRQSLELPIILETAVQQVRQFLKVDRLIIYQFERSLNNNQISPTDLININNTSEIKLISPEQKTISPNISNENIVIDPHNLPDLSLNNKIGSITYESKASDLIPSVLNLTEHSTCFLNIPNCQEKYSQGLTIAIEDVEITYNFSNCLLEFLRQHQVRSKLIVPIIVSGKIWGLLIAHQCFLPRKWQESEKIFLQQIAAHLAIAINQAQLYSKLQQQKQTLEERVIERTQDLHDALLGAQAASMAKSEFLSTISHELRTPLTCVIGMSATLLRWSFGQLSQKQRNYLQTIHDSGDHLLAMINDILELSQVEAGKAVLNMSEFSLSKLAAQSLQTMKNKAATAGVKLELDIQVSPEKDKFVADQRRVKQILFNLLSNAIKFTPEDGKVLLRVWVENNAAVFQVEDTGIGIPEHQLSLLFQKFQQLEMNYKRRYEGTGLGLALTKQLIELHRGWIEVDSVVDVGSTFTVCLPNHQLVADVENPENAPIIEYNNVEPPGIIILIEDQEENAWVICDLLTTAGYQIIWMIEGSTALKQIHILQPKVAIVSMQLPDIDCHKLINNLRQSSMSSNIKVLAIVNATPEQLDNSPIIGADDYLLQPMQPHELLEKIAVLMANIREQEKLQIEK